MSHKATQMRAAVLAAPGQIRLERVALPEPGEGMVRVRLEGSGVCGSNLPPWEGRSWFEYPFQAGAPGHEGWGEIDAVGPKVSKVSIGERVALLSYNAYAEYDVANENAVVRLPSALAKKPFPGEPLACAVNVFRRCQIGPGQTVAIVGAGFLGALLTQLVSEAGAKVLAISRRAFALEMARACGAVETLDSANRERVLERVRAVTSGHGCDCVIEAAGQQETLELASELTRERGRLVIAGYHQDGPRQINLQLWNWRGLDVINAHERDPKVYVDGMQAAVELTSQGRLEPFPLFTHTLRLDELGKAFTLMQERPEKFLKALVFT
jgi:threonine dehydrogenase-like Zn-dependent dehydrogenase